MNRASNFSRLMKSIRKTTAGTLGGQSRIATPVNPSPLMSTKVFR